MEPTQAEFAFYSFRSKCRAFFDNHGRLRRYPHLATSIFVLLPFMQIRLALATVSLVFSSSKAPINKSSCRRYDKVLHFNCLIPQPNLIVFSEFLREKSGGLVGLYNLLMDFSKTSLCKPLV